MEEIEANDISLFCEGYKSKGNGNKSKFNKCWKHAVKGSTFCEHHMPNSPFVCEGFRSNGKRCLQLKKAGKSFCCNEHDPCFVLETKPSEFAIKDLVIRKEPWLLLKQKVRDCYSNEVIKLYENKPLKEMKVDHFVPLELAANVLDKLPNLKRSDETRLKSAIKDTFNQEFNLGLTAKDISEDKFAAMQHFSIDFKRNKVNEAGINFYLTESFTMARRSITSKIIKEVTTSLESCRDYLTENHETSASIDNYVNGIDDLMDSLHIRNMKTSCDF